jgi:predicted transcriptional regulator
MRQAVLTARVDAETSEKLDEIAALTGRSRSWVAAAAVKAYVDSEAALLRDVQEALAAVGRGETVDAAEADRQIDQMLRDLRAR